jgi:signal transduction histidine kinase
VSALEEFLRALHPDDREAVAGAFCRSVEQGVGLNVEFRVAWPDGSVHWLKDQGEVAKGRNGRLLFLTGACVDLTERRAMEDELRRARDELERRVEERTDLLRKLARAQEDERRRVARDLHDSVGQLLAGLSLAVRAVATAGPLPPAAADRLADVQRVADELGRQVHGMAVRLRPTALDDLGLEAALGQLVGEWSARAEVPVDFQTSGLGGGRLPPEVETVLYRVVQESLTNVARHARATTVSVVVSRYDGTATAVIEDDGVGFDPESAGRGRLGLVGMGERVALAGGELDVESAPGAGTTIIARIGLGGGR